MTGRKHLDPWIQKFLIWRSQHIKDRQFIYLLSIVVGLLSGLAAVVIKNSVYLVEVLLTEGIRDVDDYLYFLYPLAGIVITVLVIRFVLRKPVGHGIPNALYAISKNNGDIEKHETFASILTSAITVGFGGSVGLEGPTVATTAALGSNLGKTMRLNYKTKVLLIACAASGALAAIFKAPVAAIVFALEVIMIDLTAVSLIPILLASISAALTSRLIFGQDVLFHTDLADPFALSDVPFYALLGIACGLVSVYFNRIYFFVAKWAEKFKKPVLRAVIGGSLVGFLIYLLPPLYGEGYPLINALIADDSSALWEEIRVFSGVDNELLLILTLAGLIVLKAFATSITLKSGGIGGVFAPSLFMGATTGFLFSRLFNDSGLVNVSTTNFTLVAMGGMMAGVLHAPLTGIFLIAEITGGYELFLPLMITASLAFITVKYATPHSIYTRQLAQRGELLTLHKDQAVLTLMNLKSELETNFISIRPYDNLGQLAKAVAQSSRNLFPVVDEEERFLGVVSLNDIREVMFDRDQYETVLVHELMTAAPEFVYIEDSMERVMQKFDASSAWNLPVLNQEGKYLGFVSKSRLFSAYRKLLREFYDDAET